METGEDGGKMSDNRLQSVAWLKRCRTVAGTNRLVSNFKVRVAGGYSWRMAVAFVVHITQKTIYEILMRTHGLQRKML